MAAPIAVLTALAYALRPGVRDGLRWPLLVAVGGTAVLAIWASAAGSDLYGQLAAQLPTTGPACARAGATAGRARRRRAPQRPASGVGHTIAVTVLVLTAVALSGTTVLTLISATESVWSHHTVWGAR